MRFLFFLLFSLCLAAASQTDSAEPAPPVLLFEPVNLGTLQQGTKREVLVKGQNASAQSVEVENVLDQMTGGENFQFPKKIAPNEKFTIKFTLNTAYMEGDFLHNIILIATDGKPFVTQVSGSVDNPIVFSERIFDLGFYKKGNKKNWIFYAWNPQGKPLKLKLATEEFNAEFSDVKLDVSNFDNIKEGGNTPSIKINLSVKNLESPKNAQKSIRKLVSFISEEHPNATPQVLVTGYWE